jgi:hypothetical protein
MGGDGALEGSGPVRDGSIHAEDRVSHLGAPGASMIERGREEV